MVRTHARVFPWSTRSPDRRAFAIVAALLRRERNVPGERIDGPCSMPHRLHDLGGCPTSDPTRPARTGNLATAVTPRQGCSLPATDCRFPWRLQHPHFELLARLASRVMRTPPLQHGDLRRQHAVESTRGRRVSRAGGCERRSQAVFLLLVRESVSHRLAASMHAASIALHGPLYPTAPDVAIVNAGFKFSEDSRTSTSRRAACEHNEEILGSLGSRATKRADPRSTTLLKSII